MEGGEGGQRSSLACQSVNRLTREEWKIESGGTRDGVYSGERSSSRDRLRNPARNYIRSASCDVIDLA